jgi:hypothetical protein
MWTYRLQSLIYSFKGVTVMVYVISQDGIPLMPTKRYGKVRRLLKQKLARVIRRKPFTIQLQYVTTTYTQPVSLGIDSGYTYIGFSAVTDKKELISGELIYSVVLAKGSKKGVCIEE